MYVYSTSHVRDNVYLCPIVPRNLFCRPNSLHLIPHLHFMAPFNKASETRFVCLDSDGVGTYAGRADLEWTVGTVPNGGASPQAFQICLS